MAKEYEEWKIWKQPTSIDTHNSYHGANYDTNETHNTPTRDVVTHDRKLASLGCLPDSYKFFLQKLGHTTQSAPRTKQRTVDALRLHLKHILKTYWKLTRDNHTANHTAETHPPPIEEQDGGLGLGSPT